MYRPSCSWEAIAMAEWRFDSSNRSYVIAVDGYAAMNLL